MANQTTPFVGFVGQTYQLQNWNFQIQRLINRYPEFSEVGSSEIVEVSQLAPTPGLTTLISGLNGSGYRGGWVTATNVMYCVFGTTLYQINGVDGSQTGWTATTLGTIDGTGQCCFTDNGEVLFIVTSTGNTWGLFLDSNTLVNLTSINYGSGTSGGTAVVAGTGSWALATSCTYMDGYVVFSTKDDNTFFWTDNVRQGSTPSIATGWYGISVSGFNISTANTNPDHINCVFSNNEDLWVFGQYVTELWYDLAQGTTTFARRTGILVETGAASPHTVQKLNNTLMWLSTDPRGGATVQAANGYTPTRVSTYAIEQILSQATEAQLADSTADSYQYNGHHFYVLNVPGLTTTLVFDITAYTQTGRPVWHEKQSGYGVNVTRNIAQGHSYFLKKHIVGDYNAGNLYFLDADSNKENGELVARTRITPHIRNGQKRIKYVSLQIDFTAGNAVDPTVDPQVMLQYSDDGGKTWSNERWVSMGTAGNYRNRVIFYQLGVSRNRVFKIVDVCDAYSGISGAELVINIGAT